MPNSSACAADVAQRGLRRLLHHVAELAGQRQPSSSTHHGRLDREDLAADLGPGQPGGHADLVRGARVHSGRKRGTPRNSATWSGVTVLGPPAFAGDDLARDLAADGGDLALEVAHAGLAGVALG